MRKILAIDDQQDNLITIEAVIKSNMTDCLILKSLSGEQGITIAQKEQPDTIILDLAMPEIDGFEVCKRLKNDASTSHIPILILTSKSDDNKSKIKSLELGADAFLAKPIDSLELIAQIKVMLRIKFAEKKLRKEKENLEHVIIERTEKLKDSEEKFKTLFRSTALPLCFVDKDGIISLRNDRFVQTFGYTEEEVPSLKEWWQKAYPDEKYREWVIQNWESAVEEASKSGNDIKSDEYLVTCKDGSLRSIIISGNTLGNNFLATFIDITERKKNEEALQESNALLKAIIDSPNNIIMLAADAEFNYINFNQAHIDAVKYTYGTEPEIGKNILSYMPIEEDRLKAKENYKRVLKGERFVEIQEFGIKDKRSSWELIFNPIINTSDQVTGFTVFIQDITERKNTEAKIKESEERFQLAVKGSKDAIWDWYNMESDEYWWSDRLYEILGYKPGEVEARISNWQKWMHPDDSDSVIEVMNKHFEAYLPYQVEFRMQKKDGNYVWVEVSGESVRDKNGKPIRMAGSLSDITERKQTELVLSNKNKYIESIMENMPVGFAINSIDDGDVKYMNKRFEEIYGWPKDILTNTSIFFDKVFPDPEYREKMKSKIIADMQSGDPNRMVWKDLKVVTDKGEERFVHSYNIPLIDQNIMISTVQNTTKRKLAEDENIKHKENLEKIVDERTKELEQKYSELERMNSLFVGRELRMKELKGIIKELRNKLDAK